MSTVPSSSEGMRTASPRTSREALIAELLGEIDVLIWRVEALAPTITAAAQEATAATNSLSEAGDKYRMAVNAFTQKAKSELTDYLERKAGQVAARSVEEQRAAIQEIASQSFRLEAADRAAALCAALDAAARECRRVDWTRRLEHALTAIIASAFSTAAFYALLVAR